MDERIRLLIIDANTSVRQALETRLRTVPQFEVLASVGDVEEAQVFAARNMPDVVLIEPKRLSTDGGIALIRSLTSAPQPPLVIVLTSYHDEQEAMLAQELGISCYMLKDINSQVLVEAILSCRQQPGGAVASPLT